MEEGLLCKSIVIKSAAKSQGVVIGDLVGEK